MFPFIPESCKGEKHNNQNLKSVSDGLNESGQVPLGRGWNCVFLLVFGSWPQIPNAKTHPAPFFQLVTPSDELPESPSGLCFLRPAPVPNQAGVALSAVTLCAGSVLWVLLPARGYLPPSAQGTGFSS